MTINLAELNNRFAIPDQLTFRAGPGGLALAEINNAYATASVALQGGHVISYQPHGQQPVLWVSQKSAYQTGKAIRGGIPVCWPWFGAYPTDTAKPAHGFARTQPWNVVATGVVEGGATQLRLALTDNEATRTLWPHAFALQLHLTVGPELRIELIAHNSGSEPFTFTGALHSYFSLSDIGQVTLYGLEGCTYLDKVEDFQAKTQQGTITIEGETDRIYLDTTSTCILEDRGWQRRIVIAKSGSRSTVVWNPWQDKARAMADFGDEEYREMVCIETANAAEDNVTLAPGQNHSLEANIKSELSP
jgi:D-hexose-6-phosphate mutarotase